MWDRVAILKVVLTGESVATTASQFLSYLAVNKMLEKKNKVKPTWRSILEICIRTNTQAGRPYKLNWWKCLGRANAVFLKRTKTEVNKNIPEWLAA